MPYPAVRKIKRTVIIGGKAAAGYKAAKNIIRLIHCIARKVNNDPEIEGKLKVVFIENYNVTKAEYLIPAADLSEQISTAGMEASGTGNMKLSINGALTIGTNDGANVEMRQQVTDKWWPFAFGCSADEIAEMNEKKSYDPWTVYSDTPKIRDAVETLRDHSFAEDDVEHHDLMDAYCRLLEGEYGSQSDPYFVLKDLMPFYKAQQRVESFFQDKSKWAEYAIHNIAGMGMFSSDVSIEKYAKEIWGIERCPPDPELLAQVRSDFVEHDQYRT